MVSEKRDDSGVLMLIFIELYIIIYLVRQPYVCMIRYNKISKFNDRRTNMESTKQDRMLEIFFRCLRGEDISVQNLANEYGVSTKSISRNITYLKSFLADHRDLVGNTELQYSHQNVTCSDR